MNDYMNVTTVSKVPPALSINFHSQKQTVQMGKVELRIAYFKYYLCFIHLDLIFRFDLISISHKYSFKKKKSPFFSCRK